MSAGYTFTQYESQADLKEHLRTATARTVWIGENAEAPRKFYCLTVSTVACGQIEIGITASGYGTEPAARILAGGDALLISYDTYVVGIDLPSATLRFRIEAMGVFFEFTEGVSDDTASLCMRLALSWSIPAGECAGLS